jgi:hypothetical protein
LPITETELRLIAAAANIGERSQLACLTGYAQRLTRPDFLISESAVRTGKR